MQLRRSPPDYRLIFTLVIASGLLTLVLGASATSALAQEADPVVQADQAVADAQAQVDQVAGAYFDALQRARQLDSRISDLQGRIDELRQGVSELREVTRDRAVAAYKRGGNSLETVVLDTSDATDAARRVKLLDLLNTRDEATARELRRSQDDLSREQVELGAAREEQSRVLARLQAEDRQVNAKLVAAQAQRQAALDAQLQAQQQAAAAAAAAAATPPPASAPPALPAPSTSAPPATQPPPRPTDNNATPVPVPANYATTSGVNPHHEHPYLMCVRHYESTDNYQAYNPGGPAYGAYQFLRSTWNLTANRAGRGDLVGLDPRRASAYDQDEMAWDLYQWQGKRPWSVDPC